MFAPSLAVRIEELGMGPWKNGEGFRPGKEAGGERVLEGPAEPAEPTPTSALLLALALGHSLVCSGNQRTGRRWIQTQRSQKKAR